MDIKNALFNGNLLEDVYLFQIEVINPKHPNKMCKHKRSIYRLNQGSLSWNLRFYKEITKYGFIKNEYESCVYKINSGSTIRFLVWYVDGTLLKGKNISTLQGTDSSL